MLVHRMSFDSTDLEAPAVQRAPLEGGLTAREPRQIAMEGVV